MADISSKKIEIIWTHVFGHTGEKWNERVDVIAKSFAMNKPLELQKGAHIS